MGVGVGGGRAVSGRCGGRSVQPWNLSLPAGSGSRIGRHAAQRRHPAPAGGGGRRAACVRPLESTSAPAATACTAHLWPSACRGGRHEVVSSPIAHQRRATRAWASLRRPTAPPLRGERPSDDLLVSLQRRQGAVRSGGAAAVPAARRPTSSAVRIVRDAEAARAAWRAAGAACGGMSEIFSGCRGSSLAIVRKYLKSSVAFKNRPY